MRILPLIAMTFALACAPKAAADVVLPPSAQFAPGQVWEYNTRPEDSGSTLVVCHVETLNGETLVHVYVRGVTLSLGDEARETDIAHLPMSEAALAASVTQQSGTVDQLPPFQAGYNIWRTENGGYFTIPVASVIANMDGALLPPDDFLNPDPGVTQ